MKKFKEILIKLNNWKFVILIIVIIGGAFYWFQMRPINIRKGCVDLAEKEIWLNKDHVGYISITQNERAEGKFDVYYERCLYEHGLIR
jgi:hypothetical protein